MTLLNCERLPFETNGRAWVGDAGEHGGVRLDLVVGRWWAMVERDSDGKVDTLVLCDDEMLGHVLWKERLNEELALLRAKVPSPEVVERLNELIEADFKTRRVEDERFGGWSSDVRLRSGVLRVSGADKLCDGYFDKVLPSALSDGEPTFGVVGNDVIAGLFSHGAQVSVVMDGLLDEARAVRVSRRKR